MSDFRAHITAKRLFAMAMVMCCAVGAWWLVVREGLTQPREIADALATAIHPERMAGPVRFAVVLTAAIVALVMLAPSPAIAVACGMLLGAGWGMIAALGAISIAVLIEGWLAKTIVGELVHQRLVRRRPDVDHRIAAYGLPGVIFARALGTPTTVIAWGASATALPAWKVSCGCGIGSVPRVFAYATLGAAGISLLDPESWTWQVWVSVCLLVGILLLTMVLGVRARRRREPAV